MIRLRPGVAAAIFFALVAVVFGSVFPYIGPVNNPNENTRTYTTMALVEDHTFTIDKEVREYGHVNDMARVPKPDGWHYFQMKAPANAYAGVPIYWAMRKLAPLFGLHVPGDTASAPQRAAWLEAVTFALRFFTVQIPCLLFLVWFERWLRGTTGDVVLRLSAVLAAGLGTNYLAYSLMFVSHALFAVASFVAFGVTVDQWMEHPLVTRRSAKAAFVVGFCAGWAVLLDYQGFPVSLILVVFAACVFRRAGPLLAMIAGGAINVVGMMIFQWRAFGNPLTPGHKFAETAAFAMEHARGVYGIEKPDLHVLGQLCFSRAYGFFGTSPFTWLGLLAIPFALFDGFGSPGVQARRRVATFVWILAMAILFVSVTGKTNWHGGWTIGPRYYGAAPPFFAFGAAAALECFAQKVHGSRPAVRAIAVGLALASVAQTGLVSILYNTLPEGIEPSARGGSAAARPHRVLPASPPRAGGGDQRDAVLFRPRVLRGRGALPAAPARRRVGGRMGARVVATLGVAAFALGPAFSVPAREELDRGSGTVGWLTTIWEPHGRDRITAARTAAERFGPRRPCDWIDLARMESLVGLTADAMRDEARAGSAGRSCVGAVDKPENLLLERLGKIAAHTREPEE